MCGVVYRVFLCCWVRAIEFELLPLRLELSPAPTVSYRIISTVLGLLGSRNRSRAPPAVRPAWGFTYSLSDYSTLESDSSGRASPYLLLTRTRPTIEKLSSRPLLYKQKPTHTSPPSPVPHGKLQSKPAIYPSSPISFFRPGSWEELKS